jgi:trigger factor
MNIPGIADGLETPELLDKAEEQAQSLLEELKTKVKAELRDVATLRKEMTVTIPGDVIHSRLDHDFDEIRHEAVVPGFRKGRAPRRLIQRRFSGEVRNNLKTAIIGQSFVAAVQNQKLEVLGDPLFRVEKDAQVKLVELNEALEAYKLPDSGDFRYSCEIEIKPTLELPELTGIEVKSPQVTISDENVQEAIERQQKIRGRYEPVAGASADDEDMLVADVKLSAEGKLIKEEANVQLGIRPTRLDGIALMNLGESLSGAQAGETRSAEADIPDDYDRIDLRGKRAAFEFKIHEVKRLVPLAKSELMEQYGCTDEAEFGKLVREDLEAERDRVVERARKEQILQYLLEKTPLDLPENLSARQTDRAVMRRVIDLSQQGVPDGEIEAKIDELRTSARDQVARDLRLEFIMEKVAEKFGLTVTEEELNTEIARISRLYNQRFDRVRDNLRSRGLLPQLAEQIRQDKCVTHLLKDAKIVAVEAKIEAKEKKPRAKKEPKAKEPKE